MLVTCLACHRHAFAGERACPFCGGALATPAPSRATGATRLALLAGLAVAGCGPSGKPVQPTPDPTSIVAPYGAPQPEPEQPDPEQPDPEQPQPQPQPSATEDPNLRQAPAYGLPPPPVPTTPPR
jgi:hypothetical protein